MTYRSPKWSTNGNPSGLPRLPGSEIPHQIGPCGLAEPIVFTTAGRRAKCERAAYRRAPHAGALDGIGLRERESDYGHSHLRPDLLEGCGAGRLERCETIEEALHPRRREVEEHPRRPVADVLPGVRCPAGDEDVRAGRPGLDLLTKLEAHLAL